jgi:hypothetical protein
MNLLIIALLILACVFLVLFILVSIAYYSCIAKEKLDELYLDCDID